MQYGFTLDPKDAKHCEQGFTLEKDRYSNDYSFGFCIPEALSKTLVVGYDRLKNVLCYENFCSFVHTAMRGKYIEAKKPIRCWHMESVLDGQTLQVKKQEITRPVVLFHTYGFQEASNEVNEHRSHTPLKVAYDL